MEKDWWPASKLSHPTLACGPIMGIPQASIGWFISWKIRSYKWMRTGGTPILGNLHIMIYNIIYNITIGTLYRYYVVMTYHYVHQSSVLCVIIPTTVIVVDAVGKINCRDDAQNWIQRWSHRASSLPKSRSLPSPQIYWAYIYWGNIGIINGDWTWQ
jgi:hypothetical protein